MARDIPQNESSLQQRTHTEARFKWASNVKMHGVSSGCGFCFCCCRYVAGFLAGVQSLSWRRHVLLLPGLSVGSAAGVPADFAIEEALRLCLCTGFRFTCDMTAAPT